MEKSNDENYFMFFEFILYKDSEIKENCLIE